MNAIDKTRTEEIISLHQEIEGYFKVGLEKAIRIGELLSEQKESILGQWLDNPIAIP